MGVEGHRGRLSAIRSELVLSDPMAEASTKLIDAGLSQLAAIDARLAWIANRPRPLLTVEWTGRGSEASFAGALSLLTLGLAEMVAGKVVLPKLRSVSVDQLPRILATGCDVQPTDAVLWVNSHAGKVLEYGGETKAIMALRPECLLPTFQEIASDAAAEVIESAKRIYNTAIPSVDGKKLWLTRLPVDDRRASTVYEFEHARWIPGDPFDALLAVIVVGRDQKRLNELAEAATRSCAHRGWAMG